jgi:hypothetical protein
MKTYEYEPGNGSRYFLAYGAYPGRSVFEGDEHLLVWLRRNGVGGVAFRVMAHFRVIDQDYFMEKMGMDNTADAAALLGFLESQGHEIRIHSNHDSRGRWITNAVPFVRSETDV